MPDLAAPPISPRYPLVELGTALAFTENGLALPGPLALPSLLLATAAAIAAVAIDLDGLAIPWSVVGAAAIGALSLAAGLQRRRVTPGRIGWAAVGAVLAGVFCALAIGVTQLGRSQPTPPDWTLHRSGSRWPRVALLVGALGSSAGWLWPVGGLAWSWPAGPWSPSGPAPLLGRRPHRDPGLVLVALGALGLVLAGAALWGP